jgi:hypothetical protein
MTLFTLFIFITQIFTPELSWKSQAREVKCDNLGNYYLVFDQHIERWNDKGNFLFRTSDLNSGKIETVDLTNALKPFVFYKEQSKIVVLDNTLSAQAQEIDLFQLGFGQVELVAGSRGDAFWLWDVSTSELIRVNQSFEKLNSTGNLTTLLNEKIYPIQVIESGERIYLYDPHIGAMIFDIYGKYKTTVKLNADFNIQVYNDKIIWCHDREFKILDTDLIREETIELPGPVSGNFCFNGNQLAFLSDGRCNVWKLK